MPKTNKTTELKTLKDLYGDTFDNNSLLKQEAIKWVKYRISKCDNCNLGNVENYKSLPIICNEHSFWILRFNLTEEDLK